MKNHNYGLGEWFTDGSIDSYIETLSSDGSEGLDSYIENLPSETIWNGWTDEDLNNYFDKLETVPVSNENIQASWFNEGMSNEDINKRYSIPLISELKNTTQKETTWTDTAKDITNVLKDLTQIGTPIATAALSVLKSNTVTQDNVSSLANSLKQLGLISQTASTTSITDLARALGINANGVTDASLQQQIALLLAQKALAGSSTSNDDIFKYVAIGLAALIGLVIAKKM